MSRYILTVVYSDGTTHRMSTKQETADAAQAVAARVLKWHDVQSVTLEWQP
jgi:hypothetical protein